MTSVPEEMAISAAREHLADVVAQATYAGRITYLTKRGQRVGAIVPIEVAEAAEAAEDAYLSGLARAAEAELADGAATRPLADVVDELDLRSPAVPRPRGGDESPSGATGAVPPGAAPGDRGARRRP